MSETSLERARLLKIGHCPFDIEPEDEGDPLPEPHCHADRDGDCRFAYCPQPLLKAVAREAFEKAARVADGFLGCDIIASRIRALEARS